MSDSRKQEIINSAEESAKFFELSIQLKIFGKVILSYTWPPKA